MQIPNADLAVVDIEKLRAYCLSMEHPRGKHKARAFASALDMTAADAEELRSILLAAVRSSEAVLTEGDEFGQRYVVDITDRKKKA